MMTVAQNVITSPIYFNDLDKYKGLTRNGNQAEFLCRIVHYFNITQITLADGQKWFTRTREQMAKECRVTTRTIGNYLRYFEKQGYIKRQSKLHFKKYLYITITEKLVRILNKYSEFTKGKTVPHTKENFSFSSNKVKYINKTKSNISKTQTKTHTEKPFSAKSSTSNIETHGASYSYAGVAENLDNGTKGAGKNCEAWAEYEAFANPANQANDFANEENASHDNGGNSEIPPEEPKSDHNPSQEMPVKAPEKPAESKKRLVSENVGGREESRTTGPGMRSMRDLVERALGKLPAQQEPATAEPQKTQAKPIAKPAQTPMATRKEEPEEKEKIQVYPHYRVPKLTPEEEGVYEIAEYGKNWGSNKLYYKRKIEQKPQETEEAPRLSGFERHLQRACEAEAKKNAVLNAPVQEEVNTQQTEKQHKSRASEYASDVLSDDIGKTLSNAQKRYIAKTVQNLSKNMEITQPEKLKAEIETATLNPKSFSRATGFKHKINTIAKTITRGAWHSAVGASSEDEIQFYDAPNSEGRVIDISPTDTHQEGDGYDDYWQELMTEVRAQNRAKKTL